MKQALLMLSLVACAPSSAHMKAALSEYPGALQPPLTYPDLFVEQHVEIDHAGSKGAFDAVVQKRGDELLLVGLGPLGVRAFVLKQEHDRIQFEQRLGEPLPFPPRNILIDIHRSFFKRLPPSSVEGTTRGVIDGEQVEEDWKGGQLRERRFSRAGLAGVVRVRLGQGCTLQACEPVSFTIDNEWFGYQLQIMNKRFVRLPPESMPASELAK